MKVSIEQTSTVERKLNIEIPWDRVQTEIESQLSRIRMRAKLKGFRPGKAPMEMVRRLYSDEAREDAVNAVAVEAIRDALRENNLTPFGNPYLTDIKSGNNEPLVLEAIVELPPSFELADFSALELERPTYPVREEEIERFMDSLRERNAEMVPVKKDRPLGEGDVALVDFAGTQDGKPVPGLAVESFRVRMGKSELIPGFEEQIVGMTKGQVREFDLPFPEEFSNPKLAGHLVHFTVTLKSIQEMVIPELSDDFARSVGEFESIEALRKAVRSDMEKNREQQSTSALRANLAQALLKANVFEVPPSLLDKELRRMVQDYGDSLLRAGIPEEKVREHILAEEEELKKTAAEHVRLVYIVSEIAEKEGISASDADVEKVVAESAQRIGRKKEELMEQYDSDGTLSEVAFRLVRERVYEKLLSTARIRDVEVKPEGETEGKKGKKKGKGK